MQKHAFKIHSTAFALMILSSIGLYFAARAGLSGWILGLLGMFIMGNVLVLLVK